MFAEGDQSERVRSDLPWKCELIEMMLPRRLQDDPAIAFHARRERVFGNARGVGWGRVFVVAGGWVGAGIGIGVGVGKEVGGRC